MVPTKSIKPTINKKNHFVTVNKKNSQSERANNQTSAQAGELASIKVSYEYKNHFVTVNKKELKPANWHQKKCQTINKNPTAVETTTYKYAQSI